jgi:hypothetical protein
VAIPNILPDSRARVVRNRVNVHGTIYIPIFCANCGADGGGVPEEHMTYAFYLCTPCCEKWGHIAGTYVEPDAVFHEKVRQAQLEKYGRQLDEAEIMQALEDESGPLAKLAREAPKGK